MCFRFQRLSFRALRFLHMPLVPLSVALSTRRKQFSFTSFCPVFCGILSLVFAAMKIPSLFAMPVVLNFKFDTTRFT